MVSSNPRGTEEASPDGAYNKPRRPPPELVAAARALYVDEGLSASSIASRLGVTGSTVLRWLDQGGIARRPAANARSMANRLPIERAELEELYVRQGLNQREVALKLEVSKGTVLNRLRELEIPVRRRRIGAAEDPLPREVLEQLYVGEGLSADAIARRLGIHRTKVQRRLKAYGMPARSARRPADPAATLPLEVLRNRYIERQLAITDIAREFGLSHERVRSALVAHGIQLRPQGQLGTGGRPPLSKPLLEALYVQHGMTMREIAECLGYVTKAGFPSVQRVGSALDAAGIGRRTSLRVSGRRRRAQLDAAHLRELYEDQELSGREIAELLGVSVVEVMRQLHEAKVAIKLPARRQDEPPRKLLAELYGDVQVRAVLRRHGVPVQDPERWQRPPRNQAFVPLPLAKELLTELYCGLGLAPFHIELITGVTAKTVRNHVARHGIPVHPIGFSPWTLRRMARRPPPKRQRTRGRRP
jgi:transposase